MYDLSTLSDMIELHFVVIFETACVVASKNNLVATHEPFLPVRDVFFFATYVVAKQQGRTLRQQLPHVQQCLGYT